MLLIFRYFGFVLWALCSAVNAQFLGDIYFSTPSIEVAEGDEVNLVIEVFSGATEFGAAHFELLHSVADTGEIQVSAIGGETNDFVVQSSSISGGTGVLVARNQNATGRIGSISLAEIKFLPQVNAGNTIALDIRVRRILSRLEQNFETIRSFSAEILISNPMQSAAENSLKSSNADKEVATKLSNMNLQQRASRFRWAGEDVVLKFFHSSGGEYRVGSVTVTTPNPNDMYKIQGE